MPLGRKHFRRSRDAPIFAHSRQNRANGTYFVTERTVASPVVKDRLSLKTFIYLSRWRTSLKTLDERESRGDSEPVVDDRKGVHRREREGPQRDH
jgi:hypothetical protein